MFSTSVDTDISKKKIACFKALRGQMPMKIKFVSELKMVKDKKTYGPDHHVKFVRLIC